MFWRPRQNQKDFVEIVDCFDHTVEALKDAAMLPSVNQTAQEG
jgi:hypothetical protein